jgi:ribulose-5-phosphate 4-epimerase/fuculose-1-phosphate aldolase
MSGDKAPALVSSYDDLVEYRVSDSSPVKPNSPKGYQERFIHSEIYQRFPHINSVIHSHSEAVIPFTMNGVAMKPTFHIAGFLGNSPLLHTRYTLTIRGAHVPLFDITHLYQPPDHHDMLVNTKKLGSALASVFSKQIVSEYDNHNVVLMKNHGFTTVGTNIKQAVYRAVYTHKNASIQSNAIMLRSAALGLDSNSSDPSGTNSVTNGPGITFLNDEQVKGSLRMNDASQERPWALWAREVEVCPLYMLPKERLQTSET